ncbi:PleD family two-component system response regulator [Aestuariivirga litoralis]|uniref:PleD family two-component system response regulator n=1 Tax=Aestuariivirga litoralis TaxID=2650924 RepID=UPI0018C4A50E|nr:PleD family two-component system response regulator [Aestuariivirga litoralis]MBG1231365.1 PleD family two-component system response regulator [Aestuariivirga litoralis]
MTARVLVVDDIAANVRLLEAKLTAEYFEVVTAMNGVDALDAVQRTKPDIVLLDVMMPGIDGIEVCKRLKANNATAHIPVVMVTALDQPEDRLKGLRAGADDFLTKPVNDISLFSRVKSLVRLKMLTDELRERADVNNGTVGQITKPAALPNASNGHVLLVEPRAQAVERMQAVMSGEHKLAVAIDLPSTMAAIEHAATPFELIIVSLGAEGFDGLRLVSQIRSQDAMRQTPILVIVDPIDQKNLLRALDMGVNDYLMRPVDKQELLARAATQIKRWRYTEQLRGSVKASMEMAITDGLTGLYNRRYLETHMGNLVDHYANRGKVLSVLAVDADHFKAVNDTYGHDAGDAVLRELASRMTRMTRGADLCCRVGGEEFVVVLPGTDLPVARQIGERLRLAVANGPFDIGGGKMIPVTVSIGVSTLVGFDDTPADILKRADEALYAAKRDGRNRVTLAA